MSSTNTLRLMHKDVSWFDFVLEQLPEFEVTKRPLPDSFAEKQSASNNVTSSNGELYLLGDEPLEFLESLKQGCGRTLAFKGDLSWATSDTKRKPRTKRVFCKLTIENDAEETAILRRKKEAGFYTSQLVDAQGTFVPTFHGLYASIVNAGTNAAQDAEGNDGRFRLSCILLGDCGKGFEVSIEDEAHQNR